MKNKTLVKRTERIGFLKYNRRDHRLPFVEALDAIVRIFYLNDLEYFVAAVWIPGQKPIWFQGTSLDEVTRVVIRSYKCVEFHADSGLLFNLPPELVRSLDTVIAEFVHESSELLADRTARETMKREHLENSMYSYMFARAKGELPYDVIVTGITFSAKPPPPPKFGSVNPGTLSALDKLVLT